MIFMMSTYINESNMYLTVLQVTEVWTSEALTVRICSDIGNFSRILSYVRQLFAALLQSTVIVLLNLAAL